MMILEPANDRRNADQVSIAGGTANEQADRQSCRLIGDMKMILWKRGSVARDEEPMINFRLYEVHDVPIPLNLAKVEAHIVFDTNKHVMSGSIITPVIDSVKRIYVFL